MINPGNTNTEQQPTIGTPIFICGCYKSGTSLLTALLDHHSQILMFPEETYLLRESGSQPGMPPQVFGKLILEGGGIRKMRGEVVKRSLSGNWDYSDFDYEAFRANFWGRIQYESHTHGDVLRALAAAYAIETKQTGKQYWAEKTPFNEVWLHLPMKWYPEFVAIYLVRDPRDIFLSYSRKKQLESEGQRKLAIEKFICDWGSSVWHWQQFISRHSQGITIRYEDLVSYPKATLDLLCSFLNIGYESILEVPTKNRKAWRGNSMYESGFSGIDTSPIGRWRNKLSEDKVAVIETYLGKAMVGLGYQLTTEPPSLYNMVRRWRHHKTHKKRLIGMLMRLYWPFRLPKRLSWGKPPLK